jgi:membrane-bound lytic murein transglycosylase D
LIGSCHRLSLLLAALSLAACAAQRTAPPEPVTESPATARADEPLEPVVAHAAAARKAEEATVDRLPALEIPSEDLAPPGDGELIARLRHGFALPQVDNAEVRRERDWYARHPHYLERVFERAGRYLPHVAAEVEARDLPRELAFLPVVESAFDPFAYSHGRAAGLWQIIPGTGTRFGLKQNWWYDGRRDVVESTRAALDYLEYLHKMFDGDWLLAVAAYNCGEGNVARAIRNNRAAGKPTDFWHLRLPAETRGYVPRLLGLATLIADPAAHELELPAIPDAPAFAAVDIDGQIDLAIAAELAGIELTELQALNPAFNRWATDPEGPHRLLVPVDAEERFSVALAELPADARVLWQRHRVKPGDTLIAIAKRYRTTVDVLRAANDLRGTNIRAGDYLMIPTSTRGVADYPLSAANRLASTQSRERAGRTRSEHTVRSGDSLWNIARRNGVGVRELAAWNGMAPGDTLSVGRKLVVWRQAGPAPRAVASAAPGAEPHVRRVNYTVRSGDSLYRIASKFRVTVGDILRWNGLDGSRYLQPGQRLVLHVDVTAQSGG